MIKGKKRKSRMSALAWLYFLESLKGWSPHYDPNTMFAALALKYLCEGTMHRDLRMHAKFPG